MIKSKDKATTVNKSGGKYFIIAVVAAIIIGVVIFKGFNGSDTQSASTSGDLVISKSEISGAAKFYPYKIGDTSMEVLALKASDGTIRTAFNTCQVCYNSGKGYYKQQGNYLVCQNCGNRFSADRVEKIKGGCNPVPILAENKIDNGDTIIIPETFLESQKNLFSNWKK